MSKRESLRTQPLISTVSNRTSHLSELLKEIPLDSPNYEMSPFEEGNSKLGKSGKRFPAIRVWNLPPMATCPGRSEWCSKTCYNGDDRPTVFDNPRWLNNWSMYEHDKQRTRSVLSDYLSALPDKSGIRIHSSGDFFSNSYIEWWSEIVSSYAQHYFWAYTRSWTQRNLLAKLSELRDISNIQLFASWDLTMPTPPDGWRLSIIEGMELETSRSILDCPEQYLGGPKCADCGYCIESRDGNVRFAPH